MVRQALIGAMVIAAAQMSLAGGVADEIAKTCEVKSRDKWYGFERIVFAFDGEEAWVVEPKTAAPGKPWSWTMEWPTAFVDRTGAPALLAAGYHHVTLRPGFYDKNGKFKSRAGTMTDARVARSRAFQKYLVEKLGFAPKCNLIGMSWGGFYSVRYASAHPDCVAHIYLDAPLLDFSTLKGWSRNLGPGIRATYGIKDPNYTGANDPRQPVNCAAPIAKAGIPILLLYGGKDDVVPCAANAELFAKRFKELGGKITMEKRETYGHHPHGLEVGEQQRFVDFFNGK